MDGEDERGGAEEPRGSTAGGREKELEETDQKEDPEGGTHTNNDVTSCPAKDDSGEETPQPEAALGSSEKPASGTVIVPGNKIMASEKLEKVRKWSITTYKCTRQALSEKMGRGSRTVDLDLEPQLEILKDDRRRYDHVTKLAQTLANQMAQMTQTQKTLGDAFADLSLKTPGLDVEFGLNAEAQRFLSKSGESMAAAINSFTADMNTLINKTIEDTMVNIKQYENIRIEYDAYRCDLEELNLGRRDASTLPRLEQAQRDFQSQRDKYLKTRDDLSVKLKLLQENKVKVLHHRLLALYSSLNSHTALCHRHLEEAMQGASQHLSDPSLDTPSWLEDS